MLPFLRDGLCNCNCHKVHFGHYYKGSPSVQTHPTVAMEIVVNESKAFPGVVAPVCSTHQQLNNQAHVDQSDFIIWRQVTLQEGKETQC